MMRLMRQNEAATFKGAHDMQLLKKTPGCNTNGSAWHEAATLKGETCLSDPMT